LMWSFCGSSSCDARRKFSHMLLQTRYVNMRCSVPFPAGCLNSRFRSMRSIAEFRSQKEVPTLLSLTTESEWTAESMSFGATVSRGWRLRVTVLQLQMLLLPLQTR
jgi:hypothetical protein